MSRGRILIADDEPTFLHSTAELLRREGYSVETVEDAPSTVQAISKASYDLLITDLEMPGNADLDLVQQVSHLSGGLPIIIITGFPSVRSAVACIELPVTAYLVKPVDFTQLLARVSGAIARFRSYQAMQDTESRLREYRRKLEQLPMAPGVEPKNGIDQFLALTLRNVMGSLSDLEHLSHAISGKVDAQPHPCQLINCPRGAQLQQAIDDTIGVLEETKGTFKSKALGDLRHRLELLSKHV
jgi:CheY-like chemotaxis protein